MPQVPSQPAVTRLIAGILTYNRPAALVRCVEHLAAQSRPPEALVVWNNGTPGQAVSALESVQTPFPIQVIDSGQNLGPTGGYHELTRAILTDSDVSHFYLIDDNCFMHPDNLHCMIEGFSQSVDANLAAIRGLHPKEVAQRGTETALFPTKSAGWCGSLYRADVVREVGGPIRELFFSYGEWEWSSRFLARGWHLAGHPLARFEFLTDDDPRGRELRGPSMRNSYQRIAYFKMRNLTYLGTHVPHMRDRCGLGRRAETYVRLLWFSPDKARTKRIVDLAIEHGKAGQLGWVDVEQLVPS